MKRAITHQLYTVLMASFAQRPGDFKTACAAAERAGLKCGLKLAKRAWAKGWKQYPWAPAISPLLGGIQDEARQRIARARPLAADADAAAAASAAEAHLRGALAAESGARERAVQVRVQEGKLVQAARTSAGLFYAEILGLLRDAPKLRAIISRALESEELTAADAIRLMDRLGALLTRAATATDLALRMERLWLGEPEGVTGVRVAFSSDEEAAAVIERTYALLKRRQDRGAIGPNGKNGRVIDV